MAKQRKQSVPPQVVVNGMTPEQIATVSAALGAFAEAGRAAESEQSAPTPAAEATPAATTSNPVGTDQVAPTPAAEQSAPTPEATPEPVAPTVAIADPIPAVAPKLPTFKSAEASVLATSLVAEVNTALTIAGSQWLSWGEIATSIAQYERGASSTFDDTAFDATMRKVSEQFTLSAGVDTLDVTLRPVDWFAFFQFRRLCVTLGIQNAETIGYKRVVNYLSRATMTLVKSQATAEIKTGWADWLRMVIPMLARGEMNTETLIASIEAQRVALHALDPKAHKLPPKPRKAKAPTPAPTPAAKPNATTPAAKPNAPATQATTPAAKPVAPTPAAKPATPSNPVGNAEALRMIAENLTAESAAKFAISLSACGSDVAIMALYRGIKDRVRTIADANKPKLSNVA